MEGFPVELINTGVSLLLGILAGRKLRIILVPREKKTEARSRKGSGRSASRMPRKKSAPSLSPSAPSETPTEDQASLFTEIVWADPVKEVPVVSSSTSERAP